MRSVVKRKKMIKEWIDSTLNFVTVVTISKTCHNVNRTTTTNKRSGCTTVQIVLSEKRFHLILPFQTVNDKFSN